MVPQKKYRKVVIVTREIVAGRYVPRAVFQIKFTKFKMASRKPRLIKEEKALGNEING